MNKLRIGIIGCGIQDAFNDCGMRNAQVSGINKFGPSLEELEKRIQVLNGKNELSSFMMGFHAEYTCSKELLESMRQQGGEPKPPVPTPKPEPEEKKLTNQLAKLFQNM